MKENNNYEAGTKFIVKTGSIWIIENNIGNENPLVHLREIGKRLY